MPVSFNGRISIAVLLTIIWFRLSAEPMYPVSAIPKDLRDGMDAVVRLDSRISRITSASNWAYEVHFVVTILNSHASQFASEGISYELLSKIKSLSAHVYDAEGNLIRTLKSSEISDQSASDGFSLYNDNRYKYFDLAQSIYPYTVEFEYVKEHRYLFYLPEFYLPEGEKVAVESAVYSLVFPANNPDLVPRYKTMNFSREPERSELIGGSSSLTWRFENVRPTIKEMYGPDEWAVDPYIMVAPSAFEYEGYWGRMNSWENFGKWQLTLNAGRDVLPEKTVAIMRDLTKNLTTTESKVKAVYEFIQNKTRYVSIQEGIGGMQPFPANTVDQVGYGDCKALSNYTIALLKTVGIKGYYAKVYGGKSEREIIVDFPSKQSNHVIVAVPNGADTLWLECTSQTNPFDYQGRFTGDRKALIITEDGGKIVNTHRYPTEVNRQNSSANITLQTDGNGIGTIKTTYSGLQYENGDLDFYLGAGKERQREWLQKNMDISTFDIRSFSMTNIKSRIPSATVHAELTLNRLATVSGKRMFITANLLNRSTIVPERTDARKSKVIIHEGYIDSDTIQYTYPTEMYPEFFPEEVHLKSTFGEYTAGIKMDAGKMTYIRRMQINKGMYPAETYTELVEFFKKIRKADNVKVVLISKT
jgi:hypothetical protein